MFRIKDDSFDRQQFFQLRNSDCATEHFPSTSVRDASDRPAKCRCADSFAGARCRFCYHEDELTSVVLTALPKGLSVSSFPQMSCPIGSPHSEESCSLQYRREGHHGNRGPSDSSADRALRPVRTSPSDFRKGSQVTCLECFSPGETLRTSRDGNRPGVCALPRLLS